MLHKSLVTYNIVNDDKLHPDKLVNYNQMKSQIRNPNMIGKVQFSEIINQEPWHLLLANNCERNHKSKTKNPVLLVKYS